MTALMILAALFGSLCWAGRRPRQTYSDRYISVDDVDAVGDDICCDNDDTNDSCASDNDSPPASDDSDD